MNNVVDAICVSKKEDPARLRDKHKMIDFWTIEKLFIVCNELGVEISVKGSKEKRVVSVTLSIDPSFDTDILESGYKKSKSKSKGKSKGKSVSAETVDDFPF